MHPSIGRFVEKMGLHMEAEGLPRSAGRIFGLLLLAEGAYSLDELADTLQVSKASVSVNARLLEQCGMLERTSEPGDRRDFYRMHPDAWSRTLEVARKRWEGLHALLVASQACLPEHMHTSRTRLVEAVRFHSLLIDETDTLLDKWRGELAREGVESTSVVDDAIADGLAAD
jgi:DNA-binding transcriptional regulator GbsR (MarR family)